VGPQDHADDDKIGNLISSAYDSYVDVIIHLGGKGLEPNAYIFGKDPLDVAKKVINIGIKYTEIS
ncbi:transcriptional regulator, partial [Sulfolobus sp. D5]